MDIDADLVRNVAQLARLELTEDEVLAIAPQLARIFAHVERVQQLDVGDAAPTTQAAIGVEALRDDVAGETLAAEALLRNAPAHDGACLVVPAFFDDADDADEQEEA